MDNVLREPLTQGLLYCYRIKRCDTPLDKSMLILILKKEIAGANCFRGNQLNRNALLNCAISTIRL